MAAELLQEVDEEVKKPETDEELVIVEGTPPTEEAKTEEVKTEDKGADTTPAKSDEEDIDPDDPDGAHNDAERERRRQLKQERKARRERAIARDKLELSFLSKRNDELERRLMAQEARSQQHELTQVDAALREALNEAQMAEKVIAKAVSAGNGDDVTTAMRYRDEAIARARQLEAIKAQRAAALAAPTARQQPQLDTAVIEHAKDFMEDHAWYDPQGRDEKSAVVLAIDAALAQEGFDPKKEDYWDELRRRVGRRLPETVEKPQVVDNKQPPRQPRGGPAVVSGREQSATKPTNTVYLSAERKQALIDAGVWDDPVLRMKYVKRYQQYDRENPRS